ncbi:hypothetical protein SNEBB_007314 [Seison nebaliae]|nr:hypothetical protein SNEBB_007314 [Seison nebaliae]
MNQHNFNLYIQSTGDIIVLLISIFFIIWWLIIISTHFIAIIFVKLHFIPKSDNQRSSSKTTQNNNQTVVHDTEIVDVKKFSHSRQHSDYELLRKQVIKKNQKSNLTKQFIRTKDDDPYRYHQTSISSNAFGVSIIKPIVDIDPNLEANLETFFNIKYPVFEILFCVSSRTDPAVPLIEKLQKKYATVDSTLFISSKYHQEKSKDIEEDQNGPPVVNGKILNMLPAYDNMKYPFLLVSDAGLCCETTLLDELMGQMKHNVGLIHQLPLAMNRPKFCGRLEQVYFGTQQTRMYVSLNCVGIDSVTGMSCLIRKCLLDNVGGFRHFGKYIAEDYHFAKCIKNQKYKVLLSRRPARQNCGTYNIDLWRERMIRWCKLRLHLLPICYVAEPLQECLACGLFLAIGIHFIFNFSPIITYLLHLLIWCVFDYLLFHIVVDSEQKRPLSRIEFLRCWLFRELQPIYIYMKACSSPYIRWRNRLYKIKYDTLAEEIRVIDV